jgi:hypothetical protein
MTGHGNQCAYMWCGLDPSLKPFWYQDLASTFEAGKEYTLSMDAAMARGAAVEGQILEMRLGYWPETPDTTAGPTIIAQKNIAYDQITESWGSYAISSSAVTGDAVGKNIVVYITQGAPLVPSTQQYYVDNVQLSAIAVPEPGTIAILASGILGLAAFVWRKKS